MFNFLHTGAPSIQVSKRNQSWQVFTAFKQGNNEFVENRQDQDVVGSKVVRKQWGLSLQAPGDKGAPRFPAHVGGLPPAFRGQRSGCPSWASWFSNTINSE